MDALLPFRVALLLFRVILFGCQTTQALNFSFSNSVRGTAGGDRLDQEIGQSRAFEIMDSSTNFIGNTFRQQSPMDRKDVHKVSLTVERVDKFPTFPSPSQIHLSAEYVAKYGGDLKKEIRGVSYHEMVHVWQWNVQENAPGGLIQVITDNVRLTAELAPSHWVKPGARDKWHHAYDVTAYILKYYESVSSGFVVNMNAKLKGGWNPGFFNDLTGKFVD